VHNCFSCRCCAVLSTCCPDSNQFVYVRLHVRNVAGLTVLQYLQNVSRSLALGAELVYQYGPTVPGQQVAIYTLAGRWTGQLLLVCYVLFLDVCSGG